MNANTLERERTGALWSDWGSLAERQQSVRTDCILRRREKREGYPLTHTNVQLELEEYRFHLEQMVAQRTLQLQTAVRRIERAYDETLEALAGAIDLRDDETAGHSKRVTLYALRIAKQMGCSRKLCSQLARGALLHDIGKIAIPDSILLKPGKLTPGETTIMQTHVWAGHALVKRIDFLSPAAEIVLSHHERFDGKGYPQGQAGDRIPLGARIFSVVDTLDAMMSDRPYRLGRPFRVAYEEIQGQSGKQFDPEVVRAFLLTPEKTWQRLRWEVAKLHQDSPLKADEDVGCQRN